MPSPSNSAASIIDLLESGVTASINFFAALDASEIDSINVCDNKLNFPAILQLRYVELFAAEVAGVFY